VPTVLPVGPYRFFFYSSDCVEPPHVHIERDDAEAKFWLTPVRFARSRRFGGSELNTIQRHVLDNVGHLRRSWDEYFGN